MDQELPSLKSWLFCQVGREDDVGTLSRAFLETPGDFDHWIKEIKKSANFEKGLNQAKAEYELSVEKLRKGEYSETFPFAMTLPGMEEMSEKSQQLHSRHPDVTAREYLDLLRERDYGQFVDGRKIVYLDTNFWIGLRKVYLSDQTETTEFSKLFILLTELKKEGAILCPLSFPLLVELFKQSDSATRTATAELIEHFSDDVSLRHPSELLNYEVTKVLLRETELKASDFHRWTKGGFAAGEFLPESPGFDESGNRLAQKLYVDPTWHLPFSAQVRSLPIEQMIAKEEELVAALNLSFAALKDAGLERKAIRDEGIKFVFETWGLFDLIQQFASDMIARYPDEVARAMERRELRTPSADPHLIAPGSSWN